MLSLTLEQFKALAKKGNLIPIYKEIPADLETPISAFLKISSGKYDFLFESVVGGEEWGRYSFLGSEPAAIFRSRGPDIEIIEGKKEIKLKVEKDPLNALREYLSKYNSVSVPGLPRFFGGAVGYLSYDLVRHFEKIPDTAEDELKFYDCCFMITDTVVIFDNVRKVMQVAANVRINGSGSLDKCYKEGVGKIEKLIKKIQEGSGGREVKKIKKPKDESPALIPNHTETEFCHLVEKAREYIKAGDIFQVQVSTCFEGEINVEPFDLYRAIRRINPSPYLYFLEVDGMSIVGASPELMVRLEGKKVELRPIAGTRRRGRDQAEDEALEEELKNDPKELAEHIMLVDLGRNDLGRVCEAASVQVDEREIIERYSHVMHLVSHVSGILKKGCDVYDVIRATFPAGTLTGAPKIRAMEIIEELEGKRRGIYGGAVGYIGFTGNMDMAITIRTALILKKRIYVQAAAGIVYDSIPRLEYKECCNKAMGMLEALQCVGA